MKRISSIVLAAIIAASVPAFTGDGGTATNTTPATAQDAATARRRARKAARLAAMTPEEREARRAKMRESPARHAEQKRRQKAQEAQGVADRLAAAKAACPGCYRVVQTETGYVGMTREQYDAYQAEKRRKAEEDNARFRMRRNRPAIGVTRRRERRKDGRNERRGRRPATRR